ncbi:MAG: DAK2 domain-containing protein, partial [Oscillospiraceae bacterium]|nr:DAK2 domain-containing protein [Oscillospiraceae bacterium]
MPISGKMLKEALISASLTLGDVKKQIDELNVYPVPDGDTGTNMSLTLGNAAKELGLISDSEDVSTVAKTAASAMLRGARGNSGVITSLLFRGFAKGLEGCTEATCDNIATALEIGVEAAYKAVMKPAEGTILTVARVASEKARQSSFLTNDVIVQWSDMVEAAQSALDKTPEQLPILKKAGVVDAGGKGLVVIFTEMLKAFKGEPRSMPSSTDSSAKSKLHIDIRDDEEIVYSYCTEYIVNGRNTDEDAAKLRAYLESIGNCVVVVHDDDIIKIHVHTNNPGLAFEKGLTMGYLSNMKVDNMKLQREQRMREMLLSKSPEPVAPEKKYGIVAVANGSGLLDMFIDSGVDKVVIGGQSMNPSSDDILRAVYSVPAEVVIVLPNNKNIIMAAEQAMKLSKKTMAVMHTTSIPQGVSALMAFDPDADLETNMDNMSKAYERTQSGLVTFAARNSSFGGHDIKAGDILALENGRMSFSDRDITRAAYKLTRKLIKNLRGDARFATIFIGE